jgi:hypothetical protein
MRLWESIFLLLLVFYHLALLVRRSRRPLVLNWLAPLAALAAILSLAIEGLRWTDLPPLALLLGDLLWLMISFRRLRGRPARRGFWLALRNSTRFLLASFSFLFALASACLLLIFPLPANPSPGGYPVALRDLELDGSGQTLWLWYPAGGSSTPVQRPLQTEAAWDYLYKNGGPLPVLDSQWALLPAGTPPLLIEGGRLANPDRRFPLVVFVPPLGRQPWEYEYLLEDLASQGFVVASLGQPLNSSPSTPNFFQQLLGLQHGFAMSSWIHREELGKTATSGPVLTQALATKALVLRLNDSPSDIFYHGLATNLLALWNLGSTPLKTSELKTSGFSAVVTPLVQGLNRSLQVLQIPYSNQHHPVSSWTLEITGLHPEDLSDMAFLKPYLVFFHLKGFLSAQPQLLARAYVGAFFSHVLYGTDTDIFSKRSPKVPGALLQEP